MRCPKCDMPLGATHTYSYANYIRRRRKCECCGSIFYTLERLETEEGFMDGDKEEEEAVKQDGEEEKRSFKEKDA